jgi:hypothetical protein
MLKQVSDLQIFVAASLPNMITVLTGILINNARLCDLRHQVEACFDQVDRRFDEIDRRCDKLLDGMPKHLEERS